MRNNESFINISNDLDIDDSTKQQNCRLLSTLNVPFTFHTMSTFSYEIIKLSKEFLHSSITKIEYPQRSKPEVIHIPK